MSRGLAELLATPHGRAFLEHRGVYTDASDFAAASRPPGDDRLAARIGAHRLVYAGHQLQADYRQSVVAKFRLLHALADQFALDPALVWLDTDRAGSQPAITTIAWNLPDGELRIRLAPYRLRDREARFIDVDAARLAEAFDALAAGVARAGGRSDRSAALRAAVLEAEPHTLADATLALSTHVVRAHLALDAPAIVVSRVLDDPLRERVDDVVRAIDDVVAVVNASIETLVASDIDPAIRPLEETYLPLYHSCPRDGTRRRLVREGRDVATATCRCGETYRFPIRDGLTDALATTGRWSVDVMLPLVLDPFVSGVVAGRSSALYGMVLNNVTQKVFGRDPAPMIVPLDHDRAPAGVDGVLYDYLVRP